MIQNYGTERRAQGKSFLKFSTYQPDAISNPFRASIEGMEQGAWKKMHGAGRNEHGSFLCALLLINRY